MAQSQPLPKRLQYLQPFRKKFASRPDELNETAFTPFLESLQKRIAGHSNGEAEKLLEEDMAELQNWLSAPEQINDCLHFAAGVFLIASPAELIKQIKEEAKEQKKPLPWVEMDLWPKVKPRRFEKEKDGGMLVKWKGLWFSVSVFCGEDATKNVRPAAFWDHRSKVTSTPVQFGEVTGTKHVEIMQLDSGKPHKRIIYILSVPGGHVEVSISFIGKRWNPKWDEAKMEKWRKERAQIDETEWDEKPIESLFHTLRIVLKQPSND